MILYLFLFTPYAYFLILNQPNELLLLLPHGISNHCTIFNRSYYFNPKSIHQLFKSLFRVFIHIQVSLNFISLKNSSPNVSELLQSGLASLNTPHIWYSCHPGLSLHVSPMLHLHLILSVSQVFLLLNPHFHFGRTYPPMDPKKGSTEGKLYKAVYIWKYTNIFVYISLLHSYLMDTWVSYRILGWISFSFRFESISLLSSSFWCQFWKVSYSVNLSFLWLFKNPFYWLLSDPCLSRFFLVLWYVPNFLRFIILAFSLFFISGSNTT